MPKLRPVRFYAKLKCRISQKKTVAVVIAGAGLRNGDLSVRRVFSAAASCLMSLAGTGVPRGRWTGRVG